MTEHHPERFATTVDLGCGTGLFGAEIRQRTDRLEGFDLSLNMLAKAGEKKLYDLLAKADLSLDAAASGLFVEGLREARADLVSAADVLMYLGDLGNAFMLAATLAGPDTLFAFSVEDAGDGEGFQLAPSLRYAHTEPHVRTRLSENGFDLLKLRRTTIRMMPANRSPASCFLRREGPEKQHSCDLIVRSGFLTHRSCEAGILA